MARVISRVMPSPGSSQVAFSPFLPSLSLPQVDVRCPLPDDLLDLLRTHAPAVLAASAETFEREVGFPLLQEAHAALENTEGAIPRQSPAGLPSCRGRS